MTTLTLKIESTFKEQAQKFAKDLGISLSALVKLLLKNSIKSGKIDIGTQPRYDGSPEPGDLVFKNFDEAIAYSKKLANEGDHME